MTEGRTPPPASGGGELANLSMGEMIALAVLSGPILASLSLVVEGWRETAVDWLLQHHLLVPAPLWSIPGCGGPGLDLPRILIAAGLLGLSLTWGVAVLQQRWAREAAVAGGDRR